MFDKIINRTLLALLVFMCALAVYLVATTKPAHAQTAGTYVETSTGNTKNAQGVTPTLGTTWTYAPPVGGYLNSTANITIKAATAAGTTQFITGGECYADPLGAAVELSLKETGNVIWRMRIPTTGMVLTDINFSPYIKTGTTAGNSIVMSGDVVSVTGSIYCNWRGGTDK